MQTFLPFSDFSLSVKCLDDKMLRCQIKDAFQLIKQQWLPHPASRMWLEGRKMLKVYFNTALTEYRSRGHKMKYDLYSVDGVVPSPFWMGDKIFHLSHMINLLRINFDHYFQFFMVNLHVNFPSGYYWPLPYGKETIEQSQKWIQFVDCHPQVFDLIEIKIPVV